MLLCEGEACGAVLERGLAGHSVMDEGVVEVKGCLVNGMDLVGLGWEGEWCCWRRTSSEGRESRRSQSVAHWM